MKYLTLILLFSIFISCKKETTAPGVSPELFGTWYEKDGMQITIKNEESICHCYYFKERWTNEGRFLDFRLNTETHYFQILSVDQNTLVLKELKSNHVSNLRRVP